MTFSVAACVSATFSSLILARIIITFIDRFPSVPDGLSHPGDERAPARGTARLGRGGGAGAGLGRGGGVGANTELFEPPDQEPLFGGGGGQIQRPPVRGPGLVVAAEAPQ